MVMGLDMPEGGLEPPCPCGRQILSLLCIPISSLRREGVRHHKGIDRSQSNRALAKPLNLISQPICGMCKKMFAIVVSSM